jgi:iron-sulfur cluster assembly protein
MSELQVLNPAPPPPAAQPEIHVTRAAIEKVRQAFAREGVSGSGFEEAGLRLGVLGGGCSGLSYQFKFDRKPRATDHIFTFDGVRVFVDPKSMLFLNGMTLDYKESLMQSGFAFDNPLAKRACGCGTSFSA